MFDSIIAGMNLIPIAYEELLQAREDLIEYLQQNLTNNERCFLLSVKTGEPQWDLMDVEGIEQMPGVQWKLQNISKLDSKKRSQLTEMLKKKLSL